MKLLKLLALAPLVLLLGASEREQTHLETLRTSADRQARSAACLELSICGTRDAVPALAALLADNEMAHMARYALEPIPDPAADEALRAALGRLKGPLLAGVIHSIGVRRDAGATAALGGLLNDPDAEVARAAATALGNIGTTEAVLALEKALAAAPAAVQPAVQDGLLRGAEARLAGGDAATATRVYDALKSGRAGPKGPAAWTETATREYDALKAAFNPPSVRIAALRGSVLARGANGVPQLLEALAAEDEPTFAAALRTALELPGGDATRAIAAKAAALPEPRRIRLLGTLGARGDAAAREIVEGIARTGATEVRTAALRSLARIGAPESVALLATTATDADPAVAEAARTALAGLAGKAAEDAVIALLDQPDPKTRGIAADLIVRKRLGAAVPKLLRSAEDADPDVAAAALKALGDLAGPSDLPALVGLMTRARSPENVERALMALCARPSSKVAGRVDVLKAVYAGFPEGGKANVTKIIAGLVAKGEQTITVNNATLGEPAPGLRKRLHIEYSLDGAPRRQTLEEGETLVLADVNTDPAFAAAFCAALPSAPAAVKPGLLRLLRAVGGPEALKTVTLARSDADPVVSEAAVRALCEWPTSDALPALASLLESPPDAKTKVLALRARLRLIPLQPVPAAEKLAAILDALERADRVEEKRLALAALGAIPTAEALAAAAGRLTDETLREEACQAVVDIATALPPPLDPAAKEALGKVAAATTQQRLRAASKSLLKQP